MRKGSPVLSYNIFENKDNPTFSNTIISPEAKRFLLEKTTTRSLSGDVRPRSKAEECGSQFAGMGGETKIRRSLLYRPRGRGFQVLFMDLYVIGIGIREEHEILAGRKEEYVTTTLGSRRQLGIPIPISISGPISSRNMVFNGIFTHSLTRRIQNITKWATVVNDHKRDVVKRVSQ